MKGLPGRIRQATPTSSGGDSIVDTVFFSTVFANQGIDASSMVPWEARANEVGAKRLAAGRGSKLLDKLWSPDNLMARLGPDALQRLKAFLVFAALPANQDVIRQHEYGNFMPVLLSGSIAMDREQTWGERLHLTEARLGEMSLLDSGPRFSVGSSLTDCATERTEARRNDGDRPCAGGLHDRLAGPQAFAPHAGRERPAQRTAELIGCSLIR
jgi:hypothetical protein